MSWQSHVCGFAAGVASAGCCTPAPAGERATGAPRARMLRPCPLATPTPPIGMIDSGVGGLTVARAVLDQLPHEALHYVGDTATARTGRSRSPRCARTPSR